MKRKRMKALSLIFEYALLFMFGIIILISSIGAFRSYEIHFNAVSIDDQLIEVMEYVSSDIIKLSERGDDCLDCSIKITIPKKAGNENYMIELSNQGLNITSMETKVSKHTNLYNLSQTTWLGGKAMSSSGNMIIIKRGNQIIIS